MVNLLFECNGIDYNSDDVLRFFNFSTSTDLYRGGLFFSTVPQREIQLSRPLAPSSTDKYRSNTANDSEL